MKQEDINKKIRDILDSFNLEFQRLYKKSILEGDPLITLGLRNEFVAQEQYWNLIAKYKNSINKLKWN